MILQIILKKEVSDAYRRFLLPGDWPGIMDIVENFSHPDDITKPGSK